MHTGKALCVRIRKVIVFYWEPFLSFLFIVLRYAGGHVQIEINQESHTRTCCRVRAVRASCRSAGHRFPYGKLTMFFHVGMNILCSSVQQLFDIPRLLIFITYVDVGVSLITPHLTKLGRKLHEVGLRCPTLNEVCITNWTNLGEVK